MEIIQNMKPFIQQAWKESEFQKLTDIQERSIPLILERKDLIGESPTGTGKTLAYLLPILQSIDESKKNAQAVILAPSRELVMQIHQEIQKWTKGSGIQSAAFIGGANVKKQIEKLKKKPHIIVGSTGRLLELIKLKKLKMHEVKTIVVDEFDLMIGNEHIKEVETIISTTLRDERQLLFFSATLSEKTEEVSKQWMKEYDLIQVNETVQTFENVEHTYIYCEQREKVETLRRLTNIEGMKALVFINSLKKLEEVEEKLKYHDASVEVLAGESKKMERKHALEKFRAGKVSFLLTTDVAARGLDIKGVTHVIHFDFPTDSKQYVHRSGRTGRMGASGIVVSLTTKREESFLKKMSEELGVTIHERIVHGGQIKAATVGK
ncbi:superfamily II DNA/RNA helicase [Bacillus pakistanensis]|uniref:Superfamily II DNA/RNA helicase n=2 Tax=Rossellomorea pakistanensis TaxID=992288 RepID=A0ABS2NJ06_9BACI|nr:superfamily II DNA/RNA helicase [Bacillus pakistanensis]